MRGLGRAIIMETTKAESRTENPEGLIGYWCIPYILICDSGNKEIREYNKKGSVSSNELLKFFQWTLGTLSDTAEIEAEAL